MTPEELGKRLLYLRRKRGYTLQYVQRVTEISVGTISKAEHGRNGLKFADAVKLADLYGVGLDEMAGRERKTKTATAIKYMRYAMMALDAQPEKN